MVEHLHEQIEMAVERSNTAHFHPDRVRDLFNYLNPKLERTIKGSPFESDEAFTDDDVRGLVSLYVLTSEDEEPRRTGKDRVETREEFIARNLLLPILSVGAENSRIYTGAYKKLLRDAKSRYEAETNEAWDADMKILAATDYPGFMSKIAGRLAKRLTHEDFLSAPIPKDVRGKRKGTPPVQRQPVRGTLKPATEGMSEKTKLVRDLFEAAGLDAEEAGKLRQMISGQESLAHLHAATGRALEKLRGLCFAAAATKELQMTPGELRRINALLAVDKPQSLHDQMYAAQRNADGNAQQIEKELLSGLRKILDTYSRTRKAS